MTRRSRSAAACGIALGLLAAGAPAAAQNLVANPDFDTDLAGWTLGSQEFISIDWSASDVDGSPGSGSLELQSGVTGWASQCVPVVAGELHHLAGAVAPLSIDSGVYEFGLEAVWNDGVDCAGTATGAPARLVSPTQEDVWHRIDGIFPAPPDAESAVLRLRADATSGIDTARFDAIFLPEATGGPTALAALALAVAARRREREARRQRPWNRA